MPAWRRAFPWATGFGDRTVLSLLPGQRPRSQQYCPLPLGVCQFPGRRLAAGEMPEPRELALGEVARAGLDEPNRLFQGCVSVKMGENFLVAKSLSGFLA